MGTHDKVLPGVTRRRRVASCTALAGLGLLFGGSGCARERSSTANQIETSAALVDEVPPDQPTPQFEFPDSARCSNESLNGFLDEFRLICERGEYDRYRLALSRQLEPLQKRQFESVWLAVENVRVELIRRLPEIKEIPAPAYAVLLSTRLREDAVRERPDRQITVVVFQEQGQWVFAPPPDERIGRAMRRAASQPADQLIDPLSTTQPEPG